MRPQIVALGGGGFSMEAGGLADRYLLSLCRRKRPRVCFLPSASGDADDYVVRFYRTFGPRCDASHVSLFRRDAGPRNVRAHLLAQDLIYVGGGCVISLLAVWRAHGLDAVLRECWEAGVVLCGLSAGSLCWFETGLTHYHRDARRFDGLGLLPCSNAVHYDDEPTRRPAYHAAVLDGMRGGYASSDGAALHFVGTRLARVLTSRPDARAYRVEPVDGVVVEAALETIPLQGPVALVA
jgi:dipeptidase E